MTQLLGLFAGMVGMVCLIVGVRRRRTEPPPTLLLLWVGGVALVYSGAVAMA